jgi:ankyrin repeat protein
MATIAPMQPTSGGIDLGRPGQQLLPGYVVKLLKTLKIPFGTDRGLTGIDVDPTVNLVGHIFECIGALREVNKVYRAKGSLASRSVGTRVLFGFTSELGNILLDAITFDPPVELKDAALYYAQVASNIMTVFPEIASQVTPSTGKVLLHQTALKTSSTMAIESLKMVLKAYPAAAWTTDRTGALPLHWITHNASCNSEMISLLITANPKGPWVSDMDGYLPLHWAVNQNMPNIDVVAALISANASAAAKPCNKGSLPIHWCVNRERPHIGVLKALAQVHPDGVRTFDKSGWLPLHQCVNRSDISFEAMNVLVDLYPQALQCPNANGQLPLHRAIDQSSPNVDAIRMMLNAFPGAVKVADDEGYLPLHLALDCSRPNPILAAVLLEQYPESAFHKSKDGLLPIHCIISSMHPVIEIIQQLLTIFPDSSEIMAVDLIPLDETADPETWQGEWIEKRWTPLSRAIDRGLDAIVVLFRDALNMARHSQPLERISSSPAMPQRLNNTSSQARMLPPQAKPPLHNLANLQSIEGQPLSAMPQQQHHLHPQQDGYNSSYAGPSTSSVEAGNNPRNRLVLGGNLDNEDDMRIENNLRTPLQPSPTQYGGGGDEVNDLNQNSRMNRSGNVPPPLRDRAPGGSVLRTPGGQSTHDLKRHASRERNSESRERDRERRKRRDNSESRGHRQRSSGDEREKRTASRHRSNRDVRDRDRDRDRERDRDRDRGGERDDNPDDDYYDEERRYRSSGGGRQSSSKHNQSNRPRTKEEPTDAPPYRMPTGERMYENDLDSEDLRVVEEGLQDLNMSNKHNRPSSSKNHTRNMQEDDRDLTNQYTSTPSTKISPTNGSHRPQSSTQPQSLLDAANAKPFTRRGLSAGTSRKQEDYTKFKQDHSRDAHPDDYQPVTLNVHDPNNPVNIDELV